MVRGADFVDVKIRVVPAVKAISIHRDISLLTIANCRCSAAGEADECGEIKDRLDDRDGDEIHDSLRKVAEGDDDGTDKACLVVCVPGEVWQFREVSYFAIALWVGGHCLIVADGTEAAHDCKRRDGIYRS